MQDQKKNDHSKSTPVLAKAVSGRTRMLGVSLVNGVAAVTSVVVRDCDNQSLAHRIRLHAPVYLPTCQGQRTVYDVMDRIICRLAIADAYKLALYSLYGMCHTTGRMERGYTCAELADIWGKTSRTVADLLRWLCQAGLVSSVGRQSSRTAVYTVELFSWARELVESLEADCSGAVIVTDRPDISSVVDVEARDGRRRRSGDVPVVAEDHSAAPQEIANDQQDPQPELSEDELYAIDMDGGRWLPSDWDDGNDAMRDIDKRSSTARSSVADAIADMSDMSDCSEYEQAATFTVGAADSGRA